METLKVYFGTSTRGRTKYWAFAADTDECNYLYPTSMLLGECKQKYAEAHKRSIDTIEFIDID